MNWQQQGQELSNYNPRGSGGYCRQMQTSFPALPSGCGGEKKANHGDVHGSIDCSSNGWPDLANIRYPVPGAAKFEETSITNQKENGGGGKGDSSCKRIKEETRGGATSETGKPNNKEAASGDASKKNDKPPKTDCIHVRARRGEKGEDQPEDEVPPGFGAWMYAMIGMSSELLDQFYLRFDSLQHPLPSSGLDMFVDSSDLVLRQNVNPPVAVPDASFGSSFDVILRLNMFRAFH
ncbi:hypothetical protein BHM03_00012930 [Ensete ventricosum]|nr:hypothetical protein BHM03_00012930 [Ensete ventricosum]